MKVNYNKVLNNYRKCGAIHKFSVNTHATSGPEHVNNIIDYNDNNIVSISGAHHEHLTCITLKLNNDRSRACLRLVGIAPLSNTVRDVHVYQGQQWPPYPR